MTISIYQKLHFCFVLRLSIAKCLAADRSGCCMARAAFALQHQYVANRIVSNNLQHKRLRRALPAQTSSIVDSAQLRSRRKRIMSDNDDQPLLADVESIDNQEIVSENTDESVGNLPSSSARRRTHFASRSKRQSYADNVRSYSKLAAQQTWKQVKLNKTTYCIGCWYELPEILFSNLSPDHYVQCMFSCCLDCSIIVVCICTIPCHIFESSRVESW